MLPKGPLDHCWVCRQKFVDAGGDDPSVIRNEHHVVPRCYGGENGPLVSLCSAHHDMLHAVADRVIHHNASLDSNPQLKALDPTAFLRLRYLARVICAAHAATRDDPNLRFTIQVELPPAYRAKAKRLMAALDASSTGKLLQYLIDKEHSSRFPL